MMINNTVNNGAPAPNTSYIHSASLYKKKAQTQTVHCCYIDTTTLSEPLAHQSKLLDSCHGVKFISANSFKEMYFLIRPSSKETVKIQKTTVKAAGTGYEDR